MQKVSEIIKKKKIAADFHYVKVKTTEISVLYIVVVGVSTLTQ